MPEERGKQKPRPQVSGDVLVHIEQRGSLQSFPASRQEKLALMKTMTEQGLIVCNKTPENMN
jgi:hypothetical protein